MKTKKSNDITLFPDCVSITTKSKRSVCRKAYFPKAIIAIKPSKIVLGEVGLFSLSKLRKGTVILNGY